MRIYTPDQASRSNTPNNMGTLDNSTKAPIESPILTEPHLHWKNLNQNTLNSRKAAHVQLKQNSLAESTVRTKNNHTNDPHRHYGGTSPPDLLPRRSGGRTEHVPGAIVLPPG